MKRAVSWLDLKLSLRTLVKHPGLTLIGGFAIAVAIAIGACALEVMRAVLHSHLPVEGGERVVALQYATDNAGNPERRVLHEFHDWRGALRTVERLGAYRDVRRNLASGGGHPEPVRGAEITASGFEVARTPPLLGRYLVPADEREGAPRVAVLGYDAWQARFGGDPAIVGRSVELSGERHEVVGVMPRGFEFPVSHQFWVPLRADPADHPRREGPALHVFGRLAPGATLEQAQAEATALGRRAAAEHPETHARLRLLVVPYTQDASVTNEPYVAWGFWIFQLLVAGLLVVVSVNLATLVYARTVSRLGELAVRSALGASRRRILAQLFLKALALSLAGAAAGLVLARLALGWLWSNTEVLGDLMGGTPFWLTGRGLAASTVGYALAAAVLAAGLVGVLPGLRATGRRMHASLRELGGGATTRLGSAWTTLIVLQVAVAVAILPLTLLTAWGVVRMQLSEPSFPAEQFAVAGVALGDDDAGRARELAAGSESATRLRARLGELQTRLAADPEVAAVAFSNGGFPGDRFPQDGLPGGEPNRRIRLAEAPGVPDSGLLDAGVLRVDPGLFAAYGAEIVAGRGFSAGDVDGPTTAVVVNRTFVARYLGGRSALGRQFRYHQPAPGEPDDPDTGFRGPLYEIVGVVSDFPGLAPAPGMEADANVYHPLAPGDVHPPTLSVRFRTTAPADFRSRLHATGAAVDPALQLRGTTSLAELYREGRAAFGAIAWVLGLVTASVLLLSAGGIYALTSFTVARRTREIGIRAALGADPRRLLTSMFRRTAGQLGLGLLLGSLLSGALFVASGAGALRAAALLLAVAAVMLLVGLLAAVGPARRGLRIQPTEALRAES